MRRSTCAIGFLFFLGAPDQVLGDQNVYSGGGDRTFNLGGKSGEYYTTITDVALRATPSWHVDQKHPPLSARKALRLGDALKKKLVRDTESIGWKLASLELKPDSIENKWFWVVRYETFPKQGSGSFQGPILGVIVLMDGTAVKPSLFSRQK